MLFMHLLALSKANPLSFLHTARFNYSCWLPRLTIFIMLKFLNEIMSISDDVWPITHRLRAVVVFSITFFRIFHTKVEDLFLLFIFRWYSEEFVFIITMIRQLLDLGCLGQNLLLQLLCMRLHLQKLHFLQLYLILASKAEFFLLVAVLSDRKSIKESI